MTVNEGETERQTQRECAWGRDGGREPADVFWVFCLFFIVVVVVFHGVLLGLLGTGSPGRPPRLSHDS